ncbi:MAG TPA: hypothetical protein DCW72_02130 [Elusimicrobia bacterium]|nr:MAG: hypothetical protein A2X29_01090 [Elusimicrobia bacterium GWA2_64_40]OGR66802.1 MAG: hypothetical protein A2X30_12000 [Elusimicrobia bacterium GWB2_63_16]HAN04015.1 hypothetical protein [Elusimicrobiota bacterium]HAU89053.1 hypothetical protein [Elusimicrobiota bacterium]
MADYFPLKDRTRFEYKFTSTEFEGTARVFIDILEVKKKAAKLVASARMIFELRDSHTTEYTITRDAKWLTTADGVIVGGRREFPLPPKEGAKWDESPDASEVVSLSDKVSIKAGKFANCMKIVTMLAGGDAGKSVRYYAPGVGYILEEYSGEDKTCELELVAVSKVPEEKKKGKK